MVIVHDQTLCYLRMLFWNKLSMLCLFHGEKYLDCGSNEQSNPTGKRSIASTMKSTPDGPLSRCEAPVVAGQCSLVVARQAVECGVCRLLTDGGSRQRSPRQTSATPPVNGVNKKKDVNIWKWKWNANIFYADTQHACEWENWKGINGDNKKDVLVTFFWYQLLGSVMHVWMTRISNLNLMIICLAFLRWSLTSNY